MNILQPKFEEDPRRNKRIKKFLFIILLVFFLLLGVWYFLKKEAPLTGNFDVCGLEQEEVVEKFSDYKYRDTVNINDYFFYGENLDFFINEYRLGQKDEIIGKTLILNNLCETDDEEEQELYFLLDEDIDGQIPLEQLDAGLYEVFLNYDLEKLRITTAEELADEIETINRKDGKKKIELLSSKNLFDDNVNKNLLDDNYLFINVKELDNNSQVDLVIDAAYGENTSGFYDDYGLQIENMNQAYELYEFAEIVTKELRNQGLKVLLTKDSKEDIVNLYGEGGRLEKAYESGAKYYLRLDWDPYDRPGFKIWHSYYSSQVLARAIGTNLMKRTDLKSIEKYGAFASQLSEGFDADMVIRESGGQALGAAQYSELAKTSNGSFALNNKKAMNTLTIQLINSQDPQELALWKKNKKSYAKALADSIVEALELGEADASSD